MAAFTEDAKPVEVFLENLKQDGLDEEKNLAVAQVTATGVEGHLIGDPAMRTTKKAWICIFFLTMSFGTPFWTTITTANISTALLGQLGQAELSAWVIPCITVSGAFTTLRPIFFSILGYAVAANAKSTSVLIAGLTFVGCASGLAATALIAVPELMPNKYRHVGVIIADGGVYTLGTIEPIVARYAIHNGETLWKYLYWGGFISAVLCFITIFLLYHPPSHPRGVPHKEALAGFDWIGCVLFAAGACTLLPGMVLTSYKPSSDVRVVTTLVLGIVVLGCFGAWENFSNIQFKLCPPEIFKSDHGREFTVPFCLAFAVVGFYYGTVVLYPMMLYQVYLDSSTPISKQALLTLPPTLCCILGCLSLTVVGRYSRYWNKSMVLATTMMTVWGSLLALTTPHNMAMMIAFVSISQFFYGYACYLSITYTQLGVTHEYLGIAGGLSGTARLTGGAVASASFSTAISHGISIKAKEVFPAAAIGAGLPPSSLAATIAALSKGKAALAAVPGMTPKIEAALTLAEKYANANGVNMASFAMLAFGATAVILSLFCEDLTPKLTPKTEVFLENDKYAGENKYH